MTASQMIKLYIPFVKFIAEAMGSNCEVVLHDLTKDGGTIVAIENSQISGRKVGDSPTDLILKIMQDREYQDKDYITNYKAVGKNNQICRSSTFFIKDDFGRLIGLLGINQDIQAYHDLEKVISQFLHFSHEPEEPTGAEPKVTEHLNGNIDDVLRSMITSEIDRFGVDPMRLSADEKMIIIRALSDQGAFLLKGCVSEVAKLLKTSEPTVYRYLNKIKD
ncbi:MAG: helix-turn-helix transcriptional regulator [Culicoidibacterales bacterium]